MHSRKLKIAVYIPNRHIQEVILSNPEYGNPGIGGTQFLLYSLPWYLNRYVEGAFEFLLLADKTQALQSGFMVKEVEGLADAAITASRNQCDMIIFRPNYDKETKLFLQIIREMKLDSIAWMHNTPIRLLNHLNKNEFVKRCICVGREQYEKLRDHPVIRKLSMIYNAVDSSMMLKEERVKECSVVFLGSLEFAKGFHVLARHWKGILALHPQAKLYVIGTGKLYDREQGFGPLGVASAKYERMFRRYITDEKGNVLNSVRFMGIMGQDKFQLMNSASVGIVNHPGVTETFSLAAVEFQLCGTPVVSRAYGGLLDTVSHGLGGFLAKKGKGIPGFIDKLLSDPSLSAKMGKQGRDFAERKFNYNIASERWAETLLDIASGKDACVLALGDEERTRLRLLRESIRSLKKKFFVFRILMPSIYLIQGAESLKLKWERHFSISLSCRKPMWKSGNMNP